MVNNILIPNKTQVLHQSISTTGPASITQNTSVGIKINSKDSGETLHATRYDVSFTLLERATEMCSLYAESSHFFPTSWCKMQYSRYCVKVLCPSSHPHSYWCTKLRIAIIAVGDTAGCMNTTGDRWDLISGAHTRKNEFFSTALGLGRGLAAG